MVINELTTLDEYKVICPDQTSDYIGKDKFDGVHAFASKFVKEI